MIKKTVFMTLLLLLPVLILAGTPTPTPVPGATCILTIGRASSNHYSTAVQVFPGGIFMYPGGEPLVCTAGEEIRLALLPFPVPTPPPCGNASYPAFSHWEIDPMPSYAVDLNAMQLDLIMDQDYLVSPVVVTTIYSGPPCNRIDQLLSRSQVTIGQEFTSGLTLYLESVKVVSYGLTLTYDPAIITLDTRRGIGGVSAGPDGFLTVPSTVPIPGEVSAKGFDTIGKGPGTVQLLTFYWIGGPGTGDTWINVQVDNLVDENYAGIYLPPAINHPNKQISVADTGLSGDVNGDGVVNIVDALMVAQYVVGSSVPGIDIEAADVNGDTLINIVDALIIAQYYVGIVSSLPL